MKEMLDDTLIPSLYYHLVKFSSDLKGTELMAFFSVYISMKNIDYHLLFTLFLIFVPFLKVIYSLVSQTTLKKGLLKKLSWSSDTANIYPLSFDIKNGEGSASIYLLVST